MGEFSARADVEKNRLYLVAKGFMTDDQMKAACELDIQELKKLKPGFDVISDVFELKAATPEGSEEIARVQKAFNEMGIGRNIIIIKDPITQMQIERKGKESGVGHEHASSVEEAERMLDNSHSHIST